VVGDHSPRGCGRHAAAAPNAGDREIFLRTALINLGPDLYRKV